MSDPSVKSIKRSASRPVARHHTSTSGSKTRSLASKSQRPKPIVKKSAANKAPALKATKAGISPASRSKSAKSARPVAAKGKPRAKPKKVAAHRGAVKSAKKISTVHSKPRPSAKPSKSVPRRTTPAAHLIPLAPPAVRQPTQDEAAALRVFERAHKEFTRGRFAEARNQFRVLVEKYSGASEVTARARTYLAIAEARLRTESTLPRDADSLYDRGVIELNRGEYVAAQEMFERALKREPGAAHVHYGLAATRARLGSVPMALESLQHALDLQPNLRVRAQHDQDLASLRSDPEFERLVFASRF
jgi:tetratricopeptide (TPR) repeat protein